MRLNDTGNPIDAHQYPATTAELVEAHGNVPLELPNGSESVGEVLSRLGEATYESPEEVHEALQSVVGHEAVGRRFYSDRDAPTLGEYGPEPVSF